MDDSSRPGNGCDLPDRPASRSQAPDLIERGGQRFWTELQGKLAAAVDALYLQDLAGMITSYRRRHQSHLEPAGEGVQS